MRTPVLLIAFNRPETTQAVVDRLLEVGAENVYVCVDGARPGNESDHEDVARVQEIIRSSAWPKRVLHRFRGENLGCRKGVTDAINWFFENETEGIILEDDCLPDSSFFEFSSELLERYREDFRIGAISGTTHFPSSPETQEAYKFVRYPHQWGWATWRRAWEKYDSELSTWDSLNSKITLRSVSGGSKLFPVFWRNQIEKVKSKQIDTWDYIWFYSFWRAGFLAVSPRVNLVTNIGFGQSATHTRSLPLGENFRPTAMTLKPPFQAPDVVAPDLNLEALTRWLVFGVSGKRVRSVFRVLYVVGKYLLPQR